MGATRSGKSHAQQLLIPNRIVENIPGLYVMIAKTLGNVESNILLPMRNLYGTSFVSEPYMRHGLTKARVFGKEFVLLGADNVRSVAKLQGKGIGYCAGDEGPTWEQSLLQMLKTRMTDDRAKADITGNPEGPRHKFKTDLIDRARDLGVYHLSFGLDDNPTLSQGAKDRLRQELQGVWYQRLILGQWVAAEGAIYSIIDQSQHVVDELPVMLKYWLGVDYGPGSVSCAWLLGLGIDDCLYFIDFWRHDVQKTYQPLTDVQVAATLEAWLAGHNVTPEWCAIPDDAKNLQNTLYYGRQQYPHLKNLMPADRSPGSVKYRIQTVCSLLGMGKLKYSRLVQRKGGLDEWMGYSWDEKAAERGEDQPLKRDDHDPDAGGYAVMAATNAWQRWLQARKAS